MAVIGAGPAGLTAAYSLQKAGVAVDLYEASNRVGGLARSFELWGQRVDLGPHRFFSQDPRVNRLWLEVVEDDYRMVPRLTRIYYRGRFFYYPLRAFNALQQLGGWEALRCLGSYFAQRIRPTPAEGTFESWVTRRFGRRLFQIFFKTYSEKLWGITTRELDADFAAQRIKKLSLMEALINAMGLRRNRHKTLVDEFAYPTRGAGLPYERMAARFQQMGGRLLLQTPVEQVVTRNQKAIGLRLEGQQSLRSYDRIISSMPLTLLVRRLPEAPPEVLQATEQLRFRNTVLVYLRVPAPELFPDQWLYVHSDDLQLGRITNFRNWVPELYGEKNDSILALEYWCNFEDPQWQRTDREWAALAQKEIARTGLLQGHPVTDAHVVRIPRCYPIYNRGYQQRLAPVIDYIQQIDNLQVIGRYGAFKYNNQDHSILMGLLAAENILLPAAKHNLWDINADYEYQEAAVITATGLVEKTKE